VDALARALVTVHVRRFPGRSYIAERRAIASLCRTVAPDIVHTHGYRADVVDAGAARRMGVATVTTVHGFTGGNRKNRLYEYVQIRAFRKFDAVVAVSRPLARLLARRGVQEARLRTIVNAWRPVGLPLPRDEARRALGVPSDDWRLGFVGRLSAEKGPDVLVDAASQLEPAVSLSFIGEGRERGVLEARARTRGFGARVTWHGTVPDAARVLPAFDAIVLSSRTEGTPIVLFEAMAAGVPIVATAVGGVPDVVTDREAILVPAEDPDALAEAIRSVRADPVSAATRAAAARQRLADRYATGPWLAAYEAVYREVVSGKMTRP
jgi:glycosyltransferase involved in cell wall biosynthesis